MIGSTVCISKKIDQRRSSLTLVASFTFSTYFMKLKLLLIFLQYHSNCFLLLNDLYPSDTLA